MKDFVDLMVSQCKETNVGEIRSLVSWFLSLQQGSQMTETSNLMASGSGESGFCWALTVLCDCGISEFAAQIKSY